MCMSGPGMNRITRRVSRCLPRVLRYRGLRRYRVSQLLVRSGVRQRASELRVEWDGERARCCFCGDSYGGPMKESALGAMLLHLADEHSGLFDSGEIVISNVSRSREGV